MKKYLYLLQAILVFLLASCCDSMESGQINLQKSDLERKDSGMLKSGEDCIITEDAKRYHMNTGLLLPTLGDTIQGVDTGQYKHWESFLKTNETDGEERFSRFLQNFSINPFFQKERITFPLPVSIIDHKNSSQNQYFLYETNFQRKIFEKYIGLHWFTDINDTYKEVAGNCITFVTITNHYMVDYYFKREKIWRLIEIRMEYTDEKIPHEKHGRENFDYFLQKFVSDTLFNRSRVLFPFIFYHNNPGVTAKIDTLSDADWFSYFGYKWNSESDNKCYKVYDNFRKSIPYTDTVFLRYAYNHNGISFGYKFRIKNGKWFLLNGEDHSN